MPEVLYLDSAECRIIVTFSVLSLLTNIAPYSTLVGFATVHYKSTMADDDINVASVSGACVAHVAASASPKPRDGSWCRTFARDF